MPRRAASSVALALAVVLATGAVGGMAAKKKAAKTKVFAATQAVNLAIPQDPGAAPSIPLTSTITVPKKFKGKLVGDVNVTGLQTTGSGAGAANDLTATLRAPNGRSAVLFRAKGDVSLGPWTLDDDTNVSICDSATPCIHANQTLARPFAGTSNLIYNDNPSLVPLQALDGVAMRGTWTLLVADIDPTATTSVLNQWGLRITPAKPVSG